MNDNGKPKVAKFPDRGVPQGWKCERNGHFPDPDHPPMGSPVVETTNGFYVYPAGRCLKCGSIYSEKQPLSEEEVKKMKKAAAEKAMQMQSGLVGPGGDPVAS